MRDAEVRFGMSRNFAGREELSLIEQNIANMSEKFLQSNMALPSLKFDYKTEKYQNLHQIKKLTKSNTYVNQLRILNPSKTLIMPEVEQTTAGGGALSS